MIAPSAQWRFYSKLIVCSQITARYCLFTRPIADDEVEEEDAVVIRLRQTKPTASNVSSLRDDMAATRAGRRQWIATCKPSATEVLRRWPRYVDVPQTVSCGD